MDRQEPRKPYWRVEEEEQEEVVAFQDRHRSFADKVERVLVQMVILGLVLLVLVQAFQLNRLTRLMALEGLPVGEVASWIPAPVAEPLQAVSGTTGPMRLRIVLRTRRSAPEARLRVNGNIVGNFQEGSVTVDVRPGQVLAIDGTAYREALTFRVVERTGLDAPELGAQVTTQGDQQQLGIVRAAGP